jgi:hypothetical protein
MGEAASEAPRRAFETWYREEAGKHERPMTIDAHLRSWNGNGYSHIPLDIAWKAAHRQPQIIDANVTGTNQNRAPTQPMTELDQTMEEWVLQNMSMTDLQHEVRRLRAALVSQNVAPAQQPAGANKIEDLWIHEDMALDALASALKAPRKDLQAAHSQAVDDLLYWKRRALMGEANMAGPQSRNEPVQAPNGSAKAETPSKEHAAPQVWKRQSEAQVRAIAAKHATSCNVGEYYQFNGEGLDAFALELMDRSSGA